MKDYFTCCLQVAYQSLKKIVTRYGIPSHLSPKSRVGGVGIFICIILSAVILTESVLYQAARLRALEAELARSMRLQISQILSTYNRSFLDNYGLYGLTGGSTEAAIFKRCFAASNQAQVQAESFSVMTSEALQVGITDYMKIRLPAIVGTELLSRLQSLYSNIKTDSLFQKASAAQSAPWLTYFKDFLGEKSKWEGVINQILEAASGVDITGKVSDFKEFLSGTQTTVERSATLALQGEDITSVFGDILRPDGLSNFMSILDSYMDLDAPQLIDSLLINEYVISFFDSQLEQVVKKDQSVPESNLLGKSFIDIHGVNQADIEYVITGTDNQFLSFNIPKILIGNVRTVINFSTFLLDNEKKSKAMNIAEILSAVITVVSLGSVSVDPNILQYYVLFIWAIGQGISDISSLLKGDSIPLLHHSSLDKQELVQDLLMTDYKDYLRIFLLVIPQDWKLDRILTILQRDFGGKIYVGAHLQVNYKGQQYNMEEMYDAYA